eukprot:CAMPEP_0168441230 /NCGR_PEP_ID=MMETSP0228-20121227/43383_1 /TAXON_ID=133427 /ORGANISM="Protoceratium reticulatum, Strain CCCM 535 (=CCMP 1889)" /LENGTH=343 /DNA_ID=CAMNT_0008455549 /DNA_START=77 /DNA_END=1108 /DNA_ORIENTATION=+
MSVLGGLLALLSAWCMGPALPLLAQVLGDYWVPSPEHCALASRWGLELCDTPTHAKTEETGPGPLLPGGQRRRLQDLSEAPWDGNGGAQNFMEECLETGNTEEECQEFLHQLKGLKTAIPLLMFFLSIAVTLTCISIFGPCCFGFCYKQRVTDQRPPFPAPPAVQPPFSMAGGMDFLKGPFSCFDQLPICFWSCFFGTVRRGDTLHTARVTDFWMPLGLFWAMILVKFMLDKIYYWIFGGSTIFIGMIVSLAYACVLALWRGKLRAALGAPIAPPPGGKFPEDVLILFCCGPCAVAQEAQQVDGVQGIETEVCCAFRQKAGVLVGQPLMGSAVSMPGSQGSGF